MTEPHKADAVDPAVADPETTPTKDVEPDSAGAAANAGGDNTGAPAARTKVRDVLERARFEEGVAVMAANLQERLAASLQYVDDDFMRHTELEQLIPFEAAMVLDVMLTNVAAHARGRAERMLSLPVDDANMPDLRAGGVSQQCAVHENEPVGRDESKEEHRAVAVTEEEASP